MKGENLPLKRNRKPTRRGVTGDNVLVSLQRADCIVSIASRAGGPSGIRTSLNGRMADEPELTDQEIEIALAHVEAVAGIVDPAIRRVISAAMDTSACRQVLTIRQIAERAGVPRSTVHRLLHAGLALLRKTFDGAEQRQAA